MTEMIIPGTYITVRAEGLISAGRIATGVVGVIGTAASGPLDTPITLAGFGDARELFGLPDTFNRPQDGANPLTLVRALEQIYNNGAATVVAVRVASSTVASATFAVRAASDQPALVTLEARTPGTWGNDIQLLLEPAEEPCRIENDRLVADFTNLNYAPVMPSAENQIRIIRGANRSVATLNIVYQLDEGATVSPGQVLVNPVDGRLTFAEGEQPDPGANDVLLANYLVDRERCVTMTLEHGPIRERFTVPDGHILAQRINQSSRLVTARDAVLGTRLPTAINAHLGSGSNTPGNNGADANADAYATGLAAIANQVVNIVVLAGQDTASAGAVLLGHLNVTARTDYERIGVIGAAGNELADYLGHTMASDRVVVVAPGIATPDGSTLPTAYTAAAVAGLISALPVQTSLTNKTLNVPGLALRFNRGQQEQLIRRNVLAVVSREGLRVLKGITTEGEGAPFAAIPTRRIVDFAKYGVRSAANPYIGRLNNERVRSALRATLDSFLTRMVADEALTAYELEVSATRAQEIAGEVNVVMTLQPTFSIEFVRVTMLLQ